MAANLAERIKKFVEETGIPVTQIAKEQVIINAKITLNNLNSWKQGHTPNNREQQRVLEDYMDRKSEELMVEERARHKDKLKRILDIMNFREILAVMPELNESIPTYENKFNQAVRVRVRLKRSGRPWPVDDPNAVTGSIIYVANEPEIILDKCYAPSLEAEDVDGAIEMVGNSMAPTFKNGDRLVVSRLNDPRELDWGAPYLIICTNEDVLVKRVWKADDSKSILIKSDNETGPPNLKSWENILAVFKIKGIFEKL